VEETKKDFKTPEVTTYERDELAAETLFTGLSNSGE
jgi:hypothetical protein